MAAAESSAAKPPQVACLGLLVADAVGMPIDALPPRGMLEIVDRIELHSGGNGANTAATLAKLGVRVALLGQVGDDNFGHFLTTSLLEKGVDVRGVRRRPDIATAATLVFVHADAERTFLHVPGANAAFTEGDVDWAAADGARILHVGGLQLMTALEGDGIARVMQEAHHRGMTTTLDTVMNPRSRGWDGIAPCLPFLDWALPSFEEARALTGQTKALRQARFFQSAGARSVAIKMGADGCLVVPADAPPFHVPALTVAAVDSLGAGDAWAGGFVTGLLHGWELEKTARFANAVGACCVQAVGATTGVRGMEETLGMIDNTETLALLRALSPPPPSPPVVPPSLEGGV